MVINKAASVSFGICGIFFHRMKFFGSSNGTRAISHYSLVIWDQKILSATYPNQPEKNGRIQIQNFPINLLNQNPGVSFVSHDPEATYSYRGNSS